MSTETDKQPRNLLFRLLDLVEWVGNKLPDPAVLFIIGILAVAGISFWLSSVNFSELIPGTQNPIKITNLLSLGELSGLLSSMVTNFVTFAPLGVVLVALLGVGVAEHAGFINAVLKTMLDFTPKFLLTPMIILVAVVSHTATDAGYVLVIPLAGLMFYAAGRHPLAGIAAAFAGVSGGFSANFIPSGIDPLLSGLTEVGAGIVDKNVAVNPLCNWYFTSASSFLIILVGWFITDYLIEPKLRTTPINGDPAQIPTMESLTPRDRIAMTFGLLAMILGIAALIYWAVPSDSTLRDPLGSLTSVRNTVSKSGLQAALEEGQIRVSAVEPGSAAEAAKLQVGDTVNKIAGESYSDLAIFEKTLKKLPADRPVLVESTGQDGSPKTSILVPKAIPGAPLMTSIVPIIFLLFIIPGIVHGYISGRFKNHRDVIKGMSKSMESMAYYLVLVFFVAMFIYVFSKSNIGLLLAVKGANSLQGQPLFVIVIGVIVITALVNLLIGSASAKWAMLSPIFVPMLMILGISPEFTQAAYRVGDSTTNIITPMLPYFPLVVVYGQRYCTKTGIGTITSIMLPYSITFLILWTAFLLIFWGLNIPLGIEGGYRYVQAQ